MQHNCPHATPPSHIPSHPLTSLHMNHIPSHRFSLSTPTHLPYRIDTASSSHTHPHTHDCFKQVSTDGSNFDTAIALYTCSKLNNLVQVGYNNDCNENVRSSCLSFLSNGSTTFFLQVRSPFPHVTVFTNALVPVCTQYRFHHH